MKVLHILDSLNRGGAEVLALDVCRNARAAGLEVVFAATGGGALEEDFKNSGAPFRRLARRLPLDPAVIRGLRRIIVEERVAIVHAHQAVEGLHAHFAARGTPARLVLSFHGYVPNAKNRLALKFLIPRTAANVAVSGELLNDLAANAGLDARRNFRVLYNGVDERRIAPSGRDFRAALGVAPDALLFGMIGNFYAAPRKDQLTACRALPAVLGRFPGAHFVFAGGREPGSDYEKCVALVAAGGLAGRVHFLGAREDVADILAALDAFVLATRHEGLPIALMEAMLAGAPAVLSDIPPLVEMSRGGEFAALFATGDAADLAAKLVRVGEDAAFRRDLAARAGAYARANFSIEAHLASLKKLYESII